MNECFHDRMITQGDTGLRNLPSTSPQTEKGAGRFKETQAEENGSRLEKRGGNQPGLTK